MRLNRWFLLIGLMTAIGMARVAQQTAIVLKSYELGQQLAKLHELDNDTRWLQTQVLGMESPAHLTDVMRKQHLALVAWSTAQVDEPIQQSRRDRALRGQVEE